MGGPGQATFWTGTAFDCSSTNNMIILSHQFSADGTYRICNNGAIVARILPIADNNYNSQLNVTITPKTLGKTVECHHDDGHTSMLVFSSEIPTTGSSPWNLINTYIIS